MDIENVDDIIYTFKDEDSKAKGQSAKIEEPQ